MALEASDICFHNTLLSQQPSTKSALVTATPTSIFLRRPLESPLLLVVAMAEWLSLRWIVVGLDIPRSPGYRVILEAPLVLIRLHLLFAF